MEWGHIAYPSVPRMQTGFPEQDGDGKQGEVDLKEYICFLWKHLYEEVRIPWAEAMVCLRQAG